MPFLEKGLKILETQDSNSSSLFLYCLIERDYWKSKDNFYRTNNKLKLKCIPTLIYFENGVEIGRLQEDELCSNEAIKEIFASPSSKF